VRFEAVVDPGRRVHFATAQGKALEYSCTENAGAMQIRVLDEVVANASQM
jgi:hypothetical protein